MWVLVTIFILRFGEFCLGIFVNILLFCGTVGEGFFFNLKKVYRRRVENVGKLKKKTELKNFAC